MRERFASIRNVRDRRGFGRRLREVRMDVLLTTRQAAERCNLSGRTLEKLRLTGGGPHFIRLGRAVRYKIADLDLWIAAGRRLSTSDEPVRH